MILVDRHRKGRQREKRKGTKEIPKKKKERGKGHIRPFKRRDKPSFFFLSYQFRRRLSIRRFNLSQEKGKKEGEREKKEELSNHEPRA